MTTAEVMKTIGWTTCRLSDELYLDLMRVRNCKGTRKYEVEARQLIYKIPVYKPAPLFIISLADLNDKIKFELSSLDSEPLNEVIKESVSRIFENIDERYFLLSVKKLLKWELSR
jgi:hypothetical protein